MKGAELTSARNAVKQRLDLRSLGRRLCSRLSKGMAQRVAIAQALIHGPEILILDEPTAGLDPAQAQSLRDLIRQLGESCGILLASHILADMEQLCQRVIILNEGRQVAEQQLAGSNLVRIQLGSPPQDTTELEQLDGVATGDGWYQLALNSPVAVLSERLTAHGSRLAAVGPDPRPLQPAIPARGCHQPGSRRPTVIWSIARRELLATYTSASSWIALAAVQFILAWLLFLQLDVYLKILPELVAGNSPLGIIDMVVTPTLSSTTLILLVLIPLQGMGSFADEIRSGRITLLLSTPVSAWQLVAGKWLGLLLGNLPLVLLPLLMAWLLELGSAVDAGRLASSFLGLLLFTAMASAISIWLSAISERPLTAAAMSWGLLVLLWLLDANAGNVMQALSLNARLSPFFEGLVDTKHIVYFLAFTAAALGLATHRIWRLGGGE